MTTQTRAGTMTLPGAAPTLLTILLTIVAGTTPAFAQLGACCAGCNGDGCVEVLESECLSLGGLFEAGTACDESSCALPACPSFCNDAGGQLGACCVECATGSVCVEATGDMCADLAGTFFSGAPCSGGACGPTSTCPDGCSSNAASIGFEILEEVDGSFVPVDGPVCAGTVIGFRVVLSIPDPAPGQAVCNAIGGQVFVSLPDGSAIPVAGLPGTEDVGLVGPALVLPEVCYHPVDPTCAPLIGTYTVDSNDVDQASGLLFFSATWANLCSFSDPPLPGLVATGAALVLDGPETTSIVGDEACVLGAASCTVTVDGGVPPYVVQWVGPNGPADGCVLFEPGDCTLEFDPVVPQDDGTYTAFVIDSTGCVAQAQTEMNVLDTPSLLSIACADVCAGGATTCSVVITGGEAPYLVEWTAPDGSTVSSCFLDAPGVCQLELDDVAMDDAGTYTAFVTDTNECSNQTATDLVVTDGPTVTVGPCTPFACVGTEWACSADVTGGTPPYAIEWFGPDGASVGTCELRQPGVCALDLGRITQDDAGMYSVVIADSGRCVITDEFELAVTDPPTIAVIMCEAACEGETTSCTAIVAGGTAPYMVDWVTPEGAVITSCALPGPGPCTIDLGAVTVEDAGMYTARVTDTAGCGAESEAELVVGTIPTVVAASCAPVCEGATATCSATIAGGTGPYIVQWYGPGGGIVGSCALPRPGSCSLDLRDITLADAGEYTVRVVDTLMCMGETTTALDVLAGPVITGTSCDTECEGMPAACTAMIGGGVAPYTVEWIGPGGGVVSTCDLPGSGPCTLGIDSVEETDGGTYTVRAIDDNGCETTTTVDLSVQPSPDVDAIECAPVCVGDPAGCTVTVSGGSPPYTVEWISPAGGTIATCGLPTAGKCPLNLGPATMDDAGTYTARVTDMSSCIREMQVELVVEECFCAGGGNCYVDQGPDAVGCENADCCVLVCKGNPACCDTSWDAACAAAALEICGMCGEEGAGSCFEANGTPGCDDPTCCEAVCSIMPGCCNVAWDGLCAETALGVCPQGIRPPGPARPGGRWSDGDTWAGGEVPDGESAIVIRDAIRVDVPDARAKLATVRGFGRLSVDRPDAALVLDILSVERSGSVSIVDGTVRADRAAFVGLDGDATVRVIDAGLLAAPDVQVGYLGRVTGNGTVAATVVNAGQIDPGYGIDVLTVDGDLVQAADGMIEIDLADDDSDAVVVTGTAHLTGTLVLWLAEGYEPEAGDLFVVMTYAAHEGRFDTVDVPPLPGHLELRLDYGADRFTVELVERPSRLPPRDEQRD